MGFLGRDYGVFQTRATDRDQINISSTMSTSTGQDLVPVTQETQPVPMEVNGAEQAAPVPIV